MAPHVRVVERLVEPIQRNGERPALGDLEPAVLALPDGAESFDALVADRDALRPPTREAIRVDDVPGDRWVRPSGRPGRVEQLDPLSPGPAGSGFADRLAA